jgi:1-phosphatidylinositol-4-phosphate 5-kinase
MTSQKSNHDCTTKFDPKTDVFPCDHCDANVAAWTQFCVLSSEAWFFIMAIDLYFSLQNPFSSFKEKYPYYHMLAWGLGAATAITLAVRQDQGTASADICWVDDAISDDDFIQRNQNGFVYLYAWIVLFYTISLGVFAVTLCRINGGLKTTYMSRRFVLIRTAIILLIYMFYWLVMGCLFLVMRDDTVGLDQSDLEWFQRVRPNYNFATGAVWFLLPAKGYVTSVVWFSVNSMPSFIYHFFSKEGRAELKRKQELALGNNDFSPQLNKALRREVLHFTTKGIIEAVSRNPNRPPSNWSMNALASNRAIDEFELELEPDEIQHVEEASSSHHPGEGNEASPTPLYKPRLFKLFFSFFGIYDRIACNKEPLAAIRRVKFKDYCPHVFARIRAAQNISVGSYVKSLKKTAKEKLSAGASGAFMFFTKDGRYIVKSCTPEELKCLLRILVHYAEYVVNNKGSFLTRFLGCHSIRMYNKDYSFVVMSNIFNTTKVINQSYDIKGSWVNRHHDPIVKGKKVRCRHCNKHYIFKGTATDEACAERVRGCQPNVVLKDNDLNEKIRLEASDADKTVEQLVADSELLSSLGIMDYSLIMGVCNTEYEIQDHQLSTRWPKNATRRASSQGPNAGRQSIAPKIKKRESATKGGARQSSNLSSSDRESTINSTGDDEERSQSQYNNDSGRGESESLLESDFMMRSRSVVGPEFVFMGMIDMLQEWTWNKRFERWSKILFKQKDPDGISAIEPGAYKLRFQTKVRAIFEIEGAWDGVYMDDMDDETGRPTYTPGADSYARSSAAMPSTSPKGGGEKGNYDGVHSISNV